MEASATMEMLDTTLREGEQCYGVFFPIETKKRIACLLDKIGVDFIEVGHPAAAPSIDRAVSEIAGLGLRARLIAHARLDTEEIRLVRNLGLTWVGLFAGVNQSSLRRYGLGRQALLARITNAVQYAKDIGLQVRFTCEDASRTDRNELSDIYRLLRELGTDRLSYADTVGVDNAASITRLSIDLGGHALFRELHFHFHDDLGRAQENAETAARLGAQCLDVSILGIGERTGLLSLRTALELQASPDTASDMPRTQRAMLTEAERLVSRSIDRSRYANRRFAHKSGIHIQGVLQDPSNYEAMAPVPRDGLRTIVLSKLIGRAGLRTMLSWCGIPADKAVLEQILAQVKSDEFLELADRRQIVHYLRRYTGVYRRIRLRRRIIRTASIRSLLS